MPQFPQRLGFDLADPFAGSGERLSHFFQIVLAAVLKTGVLWIFNCPSVVFAIQWRYELLRRHHD
jgi:hypothetical protein